MAIFMSRYISLNQALYIHGKFFYIHVETIYSLSMRLASYQMFFYVHNFYTSRRTGDELGLDYGVVWETTAGETKWRLTISSFPTLKRFLASILSIFSQCSACLDVRDGDQVEL